MLSFFAVQKVLLYAPNEGAGAGVTHICNYHAGYRPLGITLSVSLIFDKTVTWLRELPGGSQARGRRKVRCYRSFFRWVVRAGYAS